MTRDDALKKVNSGLGKAGHAAERIGKRKATLMWWVIAALVLLGWIAGRMHFPA